MAGKETEEQEAQAAAVVADEDGAEEAVVAEHTPEPENEMEKSSCVEEEKEREVFPEVLSSYPIIESYEGDKADDGAFEGQGVVTFNDGSTYKGEMKQSTMHGVGEYTWPSGYSFKGTFCRNAIAQGQGQYKWKTHSYEGEVSAVDGVRNGHGKLTCSLPSGGSLTYEGGWKDGRRHGIGKQIVVRASRKTVYEGGWVNGALDGEGKVTFPSGNVYTGTFRKGKKHGKGKMEWIDRCEWYEGEWSEGKPDGFGKHVWERGENKAIGIHSVTNNYYEGHFKGGKRDGVGKFTYANGAWYEGEWRNNIKHGQGIYVYEDGRTYSGPFLQDNPAEATPDRTSRTDIDMGICVSELAFGVGVDNRRLKRELENTFLRSNAQLKRRYKDACTSGSGDVLSLKGLWGIMLSLDIPRASLPLALVDRALAKTKRSRKGALSDIHAQETTILYREFLEVLVRVGDVLYGSLEGNVVDALKVLLKKVVVNEDEEGQPSVSWGESDASRRAYASMTSQSVREEHAGVKDATATNRNLLQRLLAGAVVVPDEPKPEENETSVEETGDNDGGSNEAKEAANEPAEGNEEAAPAGEVEDCSEAMPEVGQEEKVNVRENMGLEEALRVLGSDLDVEIIYPEFALAVESIASALGSSPEAVLQKM